MRRLRTTSTRRLLTVLAFTAVLATTAAVARAALTASGPLPAPKTLALAIKDAIGAPAPDGVTARITFTNNLLPSGSLPGASSALTSGGKGRLWLAKDGRLRLELQSAAGDAQLTVDDKQVTLVDAASNTVYKAALPKDDAKPEREHENPTVAKIQEALDRVAKMWTMSGAEPANIAGQPAYSVRIAPKDDGGLLGAAKVAWDSATGVPLRAAVYAQGQDSAVLELEATEISYKAVSAADVAARAPSGAKIVDLSPADSRAGKTSHGPGMHAAGESATVDEVAKQLDFALAAPDKLAGLPRQGVHAIDLDDSKGALVTYGKGLGAIAVFQHKVDPAKADKPSSGGHGHGTPLPQINIDGATGTEIATALGTIVTFERGGVAYVVAGSVPPLAAENAARGLR